MANEDSALREVDKELAEDRQWALFRQHGPAIIAGAIGVVVMVGGWQFWNASKDTAAKQDALVYRSAIELLVEDQEAGRQALGALADDSSGGYSVLARLQEGASFARNGERLAALAAYRDVMNNGAANKRVRELAQLRTAHLSLPDGRDAVLEELGKLPDAESVNGYYAREISALAALNAKDYETAFAMFERASIDLGAPEPVRARARELAALADSGRAGVNITGETQLDDLVQALDGAAAGLGGADTEDHSGHDHGDDPQLDEEGAGTTGETETQTPGGEPQTPGGEPLSEAQTPDAQAAAATDETENE